MSMFISSFVYILWLGCAGSIPAVVDIIITVKTNLAVVRPCVESLLRHAPDVTALQQRIVFVDDGSPPETMAYEKQLCTWQPDVFHCLATKDSKRGYTYAVVTGTKFGETQAHVAKVVVLLNSDTIVTEHWLMRLYNGLMLNRNSKVKIVGPLSNAASYQSIPHQKVYGQKDWATNPLPVGLHVDQLARSLSMFSNTNTRLDILNGFCFMFKRNLIAKIGNFDTERFPSGYGEEVDFSMRASLKGYEGRIISTAYVYHRKTSSFQSREKKTLKAASRITLNRLYGNALRRFNRYSANQTSLVVMRKQSHALYSKYTQRYADISLPGSLLFIVPHLTTTCERCVAVLQEVYQLRAYGVVAAVALPYLGNIGGYMSGNKTNEIWKNGSDRGKTLAQTVREILPDITLDMLRDMVLVIPPDTPGSHAAVSSYDIIIATHYTVMDPAVALVRRRVDKMLVYYVEDYSPWVFSSPYHHFQGSPLGSTNSGMMTAPLRTSQVQQHKLTADVTDEYTKALRSFTANDKKLFIISTSKWTAGLIHRYHGVKAEVVMGSVDHDQFYPNMTQLSARMRPDFNQPLHIVATLGPNMEVQGNALNTLVVLLRLVHNLPVRVTLFDCDHGQLNALMVGGGGHEEMTFNAPYMTDNVLNSSTRFMCEQRGGTRPERMEIFQSADIFVDMSYWLAYPSLGFEAMASGCVAFLPSTGTAQSVCKNGKYCIVHDSQDSDGFYSKIAEFVSGDNTARQQLIEMGIKKTWEHTIQNTAASVACVLKSAYNTRQMRH